PICPPKRTLLIQSPSRNINYNNVLPDFSGRTRHRCHTLSTQNSRFGGRTASETATPTVQLVRRQRRIPTVSVRPMDPRSPQHVTLDESQGTVGATHWRESRFSLCRFRQLPACHGARSGASSPSCLR